MLDNTARTKQISRSDSLVEQVFLELKALQKDARRETVVTILGKLGSIGRRKEVNGDSILHELARYKIEATEIAVDVALKEYAAYPDPINVKQESPILVAAASDNRTYLKAMKRYNLSAGRPLSQMDPQRPYKVDFKRKNYAGFNGEQIAEQHLNFESARIIRRNPMIKG